MVSSKKTKGEIAKSFLELEDNNGNKAFSKEWVEKNILDLSEKGNS
jgi:hypothetical protein